MREPPPKMVWRRGSPPHIIDPLVRAIFSGPIISPLVRAAFEMEPDKRSWGKHAG